MKIAVVTDSTSYLTKELIDRFGIFVVPLSVNFGNRTYRENIDITTTEFYKLLEEESALPTTSQPSIGDFIKLYSSLKEDGYEAAIAIHLSSGISGTYAASVSASKEVGLNVQVFDSEISCYAQGFMVLEAAQMVQEGKGLEEITTRLNYLIKEMRGYFIVDDLKHLHRGGRLNAAQFLLGSMLQVKPILHFQETKIVPFEKIRTQKKAIERVFELLAHDVLSGQKIKLSVVHANVLTKAEELAEEIQGRYRNVEVIISEFGPVIGTHVGPGTLGFVWYIV